MALSTYQLEWKTEFPWAVRDSCKFSEQQKQWRILCAPCNDTLHSHTGTLQVRESAALALHARAAFNAA